MSGSGLAIAALRGVARTRFAPAPTGWLHLGHVANAVFVWGTARAAGAAVLLRIEDHDRARCRPEYDAGLLEDLAWLGFVARRGPGPPARRRRAVRGRARSTPRRRPRLRLRLLADDVRGVGRRARPAMARRRLPGRLPRARPRRPDAAGDARRRERALDGRDRRTVRGRGGGRVATRRSATGTGTGRTSCRSSSTISARASTSSSAGATCWPRRPTRSGSAACSGARRRRPSPTTRSSGTPTAGSCRRPTATRRSGTCGRPAARPRPSSVRRPPRSG